MGRATPERERSERGLWSVGPCPSWARENFLRTNKQIAQSHTARARAIYLSACSGVGHMKPAAHAMCYCQLRGTESPL